MARRSGKRRKPRPRKAVAAAPAESAAAPAASAESGARKAPPARPAKSRRRRGADEPPPAPWGSFPLVELMVFVGLILLVAGFVTAGRQGMIMIGGGLALGSFAGLELSLREHLAGYRSHNILLAGTAGVLTVAALFALAPGMLPAARLAAGLAVFLLAAIGLRAVFRRRSGGASFRVGGFRG